MYRSKQSSSLLRSLRLGGHSWKRSSAVKPRLLSSSVNCLGTPLSARCDVSDKRTTNVLSCRLCTSLTDQPTKLSFFLQSEDTFSNKSIISSHSLKYTSSSDQKFFSNPQLFHYTPLLSPDWVVIRNYHTTTAYSKDESKVEKTVKALKEKQKTVTETPSVTPSPPSVPETPAATPAVKKTIWQRVKAEVVHYYHGFRLLFIDVKLCLRHLRAVLNGKSLTRRERNQLVRTTADMFRLVPFLVFIVVPFMEFLLPVAIKLFPNMLPSTFQEADKEQEKIRKRFKVKLEMAKFLQDTIEETALTKKGAHGERVQEFADFMNKIRASGVETSNEEIIKYSKLFEDEITLDNLTHGQLRALCKLLEVNTVVGTNNFLRFQIQMKLRQLEADDKMIRMEGVDSLTVWELQQACRARGMRALGVPQERLKSQLLQWLDLHLEEKIPTSLLLLSRTLFLPETLSTGDQLKATISVLPDTTTEEAKVKISEVTGERVDNRAKLGVIQQEEAIIQQEKEERQQAEEAAAEVTTESVPAQKEAATDVSEPAAVIREVDTAPELTTAASEVLVDKADTLDDKTEAVSAAEKEISSRDLEELEQVLEAVASEGVEGRELETLKTDVSEYKENLEDLREVMVATGDAKEELHVSKTAKRLSKRVDRMITQMHVVFDELHRQKEALLEDIEVKEVHIRRNAHLKEDEEARQEVLEVISDKKKHLVDINDLLLAVKRLQKVGSETRMQTVAQVLDADRDGKVDIEDALKVIEQLGRENVKISADQMSDIMDILRKEEEILEVEKVEKIREKEEKKKLKDEEPTAEDSEQTEVKQESQKL